MGDRHPSIPKTPTSPKAAHQWKRHTLSISSARLEYAQAVQGATNSGVNPLQPPNNPSPSLTERGLLLDAARRPSYLSKGKAVFYCGTWGI